MVNLISANLIRTIKCINDPENSTVIGSENGVEAAYKDYKRQLIYSIAL